jgi:uncharacterized membrane protein YkvA (DUF1232 family)
MNAEYNLEITQEVTKHFNGILNKNNTVNSEVAICDLQLMLDTLKNTQQEKYVLEHIAPLENMLQMFIDNQWSLSTSTKKYLLAAFSYLAENDDLIPDDTPVIGLLDDCIVIDIVANKIQLELDNYRSFSKCRSVYAKNHSFTTGDWSKIKKLESISSRRNRRNKALSHSRLRRSRVSFL